MVAEGIIQPFARVNFQNSPVDCFGKRDALAESVPKLRIRLSSRAAPRRRVKYCSKIVCLFKSRGHAAVKNESMSLLELRSHGDFLLCMAFG